MAPKLWHTAWQPHLLSHTITILHVGGGDKGEFDQLIAMSQRSDFNESLKHDPGLTFTMATSRRVDMYAKTHTVPDWGLRSLCMA